MPQTHRPLSHFLLCSAAAVLVMLGGCSPAANTETSTAGIGSATGLPTFDGARAFDLLKKQVEFGPRVPGTQPHSDCGAFLIETLRPLADEVTTQEFAATLGGKDLRLKNIIARFNPGAKRWVLLCAHWDTRPTADYEVVAEKRRLPIPGANDGASGTAVLLELARMFKQRKPDIGVVMVFFDGEDYGPGPNDMFLGSRHLASEALKGNLQPKRENIAYGILLDMIGDKDLRIPKEQYSLEAAPDVVRKIWDTAKALGHEKAFPDATGNAIMDDHVPLIKAGIKCVNLIDFEYGPWHTLEDSVDKCSARSLKTVGDVVGAVVYGEEGI